MSAAGRPPLLGIRHVALYTGDIEGAERFWIDVMGYEVEWRPDPDNLYLRGGRDNLALHRRVGPDPGRVGPGPAPDAAERLDHIGLAVPAAGDVDAWAAHLAAHGVTLEKAPKTHRDGSRSLYLRGPDGLLIQIIHHAPLSLD